MHAADAGIGHHAISTGVNLRLALRLVKRILRLARANAVQLALNGIFFSSVIGLLAGVIPALRASRLVPVEAIRSK